jgi:ceramide glucosyltransferase
MDNYSYFEFFLMTFIGTSLLIQTVGLVCLFIFRFVPLPKLNLPVPLPGASIIKPCFSNLDSEESNFKVFFEQDYAGPIQLIFVVSNETDPIVPIVKGLFKKYPNVDAQLVVSKTRRAYWHKIDAMYDAHQKIKHEFIIWSDSDAIVRQNYVSQMVACLNERGVSLVTTPQYDARVNNFATALKALGNNCDVGSFVMHMHTFSRQKKVAWGHSIGFKRSEFQAFEKEAWERLSDSFGDDLVLPFIFNKYRKKVVFRNIYCPVQYSSKTLRQMIFQQERFALCQKAFLGKGTTLWGPLLSPVVMGSILCLVSPLNPLSWQILALAVGFRIAVSVIFESLILRSVRMTARYFWTIPLWDLLRVYLVLYAFTHNKVEYHGKVYRFVDQFRLQDVTVTPSANHPRTEWVPPESDRASAQIRS